MVFVLKYLFLNSLFIIFIKVETKFNDLIIIALEGDIESIFKKDKKIIIPLLKYL